MANLTYLNKKDCGQDSKKNSQFSQSVSENEDIETPPNIPSFTAQLQAIATFHQVIYAGTGVSNLPHGFRHIHASIWHT